MMDLGEYGEKFDELDIPRDVAGGYAEMFRGSYFVVKAGGDIATKGYTTAEDLVLMYNLGIRAILVHGGKEAINQELRERKIASEFVDGYRVTTPEVMEAVEKALDRVNERFCTEIERAGGHAVGLKKLIWAWKHAPIGGRDLGLVGEPYYFDNGRIDSMAEDNILVVSPVSYISDIDSSCNTNADTAAGFIAGDIKARKLIFLTNVNGVSIEGSRVSELTKSKAESCIHGNYINEGMLPKVRHAIEAKSKGVKDVHIINGKTRHAVLREVFSDEGIGTMITNGS